MEVLPGMSAYPGLTLKATHNSIICFGYKILGDKKSQCKNAWDYKSWKKNVNDDKEICKYIYDTLSKADCVITHNGKRFDWKFLQTRLLSHNLKPLQKIAHVDTCAVAKSNLYAFNNRLNTLAKLLTKKQKMEHEGWSLWTKVLARDAKAMKKMTAYCKMDVEVLEAIFLKLRPFIKNIPNANLYKDDVLGFCPTCGSASIKKNGTRPTRSGRVQCYQCTECGSNAQQSSRQKIITAV